MSSSEHATTTTVRPWGDEELAARLGALDPVPGARHSLAVALVEGDRVRFAGTAPEGAAADERTAFEIGSVTKALTGMLLAELVAEGRLRHDTPVTDLLPGRRFTDPRLVRTTVTDLATHRSGLPRLPRRGPLGFLRDLRTALRGGDPYGGAGPEEVMKAALATRAAGPPGQFAYSNLGAALLGLALAEHLGTDYRRLLHERLLEPLHMAETAVCASASDLPAERARPHFRDGTPVSPWFSAGYAPAGVGVWSTARDLAALLTALARGAAPGADATTPRADAVDGHRIGLGWLLHDRADGRTVLWHNGGTGGSASYLALEPDSGCGVAVLSNTDHSVDELGAALHEAYLGAGG